MDRFSHKVIIISKNWMVLVWRITDDLPNSLNFPSIWYNGLCDRKAGSQTNLYGATLVNLFKVNAFRVMQNQYIG